MTLKQKTEKYLELEQLWEQSRVKDYQEMEAAKMDRVYNNRSRNSPLKGKNSDKSKSSSALSIVDQFKPVVIHKSHK